MNFGQALEAIKEGKKVKRGHWGGYWFLPKQVKVIIELDDPYKPFTAPTTNPMIIACLKDNGGFITATPYQEDLLAEDWEIIK